MSHLITTKIGQSRALLAFRSYLNTTIGVSGIKARLFRNNFVPNADTVLGDFTEANFNGYTAGGQALTNSFGVPTTTGAGYAQIESPDVLGWTASNGLQPNTIYGYYVVDSTDGTLLWCELTDAPLDMTTTGKRINLTLRYSMKSEY